MITLIDRRNSGYSQCRDAASVENVYSFFKNGYDNLTKLLDENLSASEFWDIVNEYYCVDLFKDELYTYLDCNKLGIKPKRLQTEFVTYVKQNNSSAPRYRFEDWLVMETGKFDGRRIYSEAEIKDLIENNQIVPLYMNASRPSSSRLELIENKYHNYELYYQNRFLIEEDMLDTTYGNVENITYYHGDLEDSFYSNQIIQDRIRKVIFTKEKIMQDIDYYRFKALEGLKLLKKVAIVNDRFRDALESERYSLIKELK